MIGKALDVLNAPGSTREEFQAVFNSRNLGSVDVEELNPELWEELRIGSAVAENELLGREQAEEQVQGTSQVLDRPPRLSEAAGPSAVWRETPIADIPRTSLEGLEGSNPDLH